jgi:anti-anti-sigma factor
MRIRQARENGVTVIGLSGSLDAFAAPRAEESLTSLCEGTEGPVVLDLADLEYVSSSGLQALLCISKQFEKRGQPLVLCHPSPFVARVLEISHLTDYFTVVPSREQAVESLAC